MIRTELFRLNGTVERDPAIEAWLNRHGGELGAIARKWFEAMRECGDEVREVLHDGCPVACLGDAAFGYVNVFTAHVNVGFYQGSALPDPAHLLQGEGKFMRHVKLKTGLSRGLTHRSAGSSSRPTPTHQSPESKTAEHEKSLLHRAKTPPGAWRVQGFLKIIPGKPKTTGSPASKPMRQSPAAQFACHSAR